MKKFVIGVDLDGVLADFNYGFKNKLFEVSGKRLIKLDEEPKCWDYPKEYGYTTEETDAAWDLVKADPMFWATLRPEVGARNALAALHALRIAGNVIYFITTRPGYDPHLQSQYWVMQFFPHPTVIVSSRKGDVAKGVGLEYFIDDKPSNCLEVKAACPQAKVYLLERRWNESAREDLMRAGIVLAPSIQMFLREVKEAAEASALVV